jgi:protein SCO1/2
MATPQQDALARQVGIDPRLGAQLPLELMFNDERGDRVPLSRYFGDRPVVLLLVYYECPMLCQLTWSGLLRALRPLDLEPLRDFELVAVSIDDRERSELAQEKKHAILAEYRRPQTAPGIHLLTGDRTAIDALCAAAGYRFVYDEKTQEYAHAAGAYVLTPQGAISRVLFGVDFAPRELKLALSEASAGKVGGLGARVLLLCYQYDPTSGRYSLAVMRILRVSAALTAAALALTIVLLRRRERRQAPLATLAGAGMGESS